MNQGQFQCVISDNELSISYHSALDPDAPLRALQNILYKHPDIEDFITENEDTKAQTLIIQTTNQQARDKFHVLFQAAGVMSVSNNVPSLINP